MCLRYSSSVVAPIVRSSPRARAGLSRLPASIDALGLAGADDRVQLVDEQDDLARRCCVTSLMTALSRSSNSPRYFAPAISAPMSSATIRLSLSTAGTSPLTMRMARPSTMAVLPTPGSPMSTGLFFVRAAEHLHRPADLLVAADDRVELALPRHLDEVAAVASAGPGTSPRGSGRSRAARRGRPSGRRGSRRGRRALTVRISFASLLTCVSAEQQVLGRDVLVLQPVGFLLRLGEDVLRRCGPCRVCVPVALGSRSSSLLDDLPDPRRRSRRSSGAAAGRRPPLPPAAPPAGAAAGSPRGPAAGPAPGPGRRLPVP